jgi:hypothetical protein
MRNLLIAFALEPARLITITSRIVSPAWAKSQGYGKNVQGVDVDGDCLIKGDSHKTGGCSAPKLCVR